jgi:hypothetical protein
VILVFHFRFGQRRAVVNAPVDRLQPAIDVALLEKVDERPGDGGLLMEVHREVGLFPLPKHAQPLEIALVRFHKAARVFAAHAPELRGGHFRGLSAQLFFHFRFDRKPVAIPAGNIRRRNPAIVLDFTIMSFRTLLSPVPR